MQRSRETGRGLVALTLLLVALAAGCGGDAAVPTADVVARMEDFEIELSADVVDAGTVVIGMENDGPTVHELVVARTDRPADELALGEDGLSVTEEAPGFRVLGEDENVQLDEQDVLELVLEPGHYVLFCNFQGHYLGGMHADLEVEA